MRADSLGLFWEDYSHGTGGARLRIAPPVPDTGWTTPRAFPRLSSARVLALDTETYDPNLLTHGPGNVRPGANGEAHDGHIVGVSLATEDAAWYFPLRHPDSDNVDADRFFAWLAETLDNERQPKVGANIAYDIGWLETEGVEVRGSLYDVQIAEPLLDDNAFTYDLDSLAQKYMGHGKTTSALYEWCAAAFGGHADATQRANIWRTPAKLVGPYAEDDARLPLAIIRAQIAALKKEKLYDLFRMETGLVPLLLAMRKRGVRVDTARAAEVRDKLNAQCEEAQALLDAEAGAPVNVNAAASLAEAFDAVGVKYRRLPSGRASFKKAWLQAQGHPIAQHIMRVRKLSKASATFIDSYIFEHAVGDRIHAQFHPLRTGSNGAATGRFASSNPNLQNIPSRDEETAPLIRALYIPDEGFPLWRRFDYSQIEYRLLAHFASGDGAEEVRDAYRNDPKIDFHAMVSDLIADIAHIQLGRPLTKNVNFGLVYGMARDTLRAYLNVSEEDADKIFSAYHVGARFIKHTYESAMREARDSGFVATVLGRKRRFVWYESAVSGVFGQPMKRDAAKRAYGFVKPAYTHKALNARLQGSAADIIKQAMVDAWDAGVLDATGVPHLQVHDELGFSDAATRESDEAFAELQHIMETCVPLRVPVLVDSSTGATWGACK